MELLTLAPGSDRIPVELFQILKDDAVESAVLSMQYALNMQYAGSRQKSKSEVAQSCLTLSDPMDCSPPGSSVHGSFQARVLEWGAIAFSDMHTSRIYNLIPYIHMYVVVVVQSLSCV